MTRKAVGQLDTIPDGGSIRCEVDGREIALFRKGTEAFAIDAICPHRGGPLDGVLEGDHLTVCPWHGWAFDVRTGLSPDQPARVFCYAVSIENGEVFIETNH